MIRSELIQKIADENPHLFQRIMVGIPLMRIFVGRLADMIRLTDYKGN